MNIGALIVSCGEPQVERCVHAVYNQTVPFSSIVHISDVKPECDAFNLGMLGSKEEWTMKVDGDMILNENAVEVVLNEMEKHKDDRICGYYFLLDDTFLKCPIGFVNILNTSDFKTSPYTDSLRDDHYASRYMRSQGKILKKFDTIIGTHFDNPDAFQVFRRFYVQSYKFGTVGFVPDQLNVLLKETGNPLYSVGLDAIEFLKKNPRKYPGSRNLDYDREVFEEFMG
jgi:hypothetical protein